MTLPEVIPIFPLPNVVFFPRMLLPLHIFEPRYRAMTRDATRGARIIGMVALRQDWEETYAGSPAIFPIGTAGEIVRIQELPDGRYNLVLRGLTEFVVSHEVDRRTPYRQAAVASRPLERDPLGPGVRVGIGRLVRRYLERVGRGAGPGDLDGLDVDDETFVNFLSQHLDLAALDKQAILEVGRLSERAYRLRDVLEFALESLRTQHGSVPGGRPH